MSSGRMSSLTSGSPGSAELCRLATISSNADVSIERLGWVAVRLFYRVNGHDIRPAPDEAFDLIVSIAGGRLHDVTSIADRLASWRQPRRL